MKGIGPQSHGSKMHTDVMKTEALKQALTLHKFDAAIGGARRDEEKSRSKERIFSFRSPSFSWDSKNQRPELWMHFNTQLKSEETVRVFPLSNWTEMDVWQYIKLEEILIPDLYYSHEREVFERSGSLLAVTEYTPLQEDEKSTFKKVRFRTIGDTTCTGAVESNADNIDQIISEVAAAHQTERGTRADDRRTETAMEDRKKEGYF